MGYLAIFSILLTSTLCYRLAECDPCPSLQVSEHNCTCEPNTAGQLKFAEGEVLLCDGLDWNTLEYEPPAYGSKKNPGSSCHDIKINKTGAANGVYWIALQSNSREAFQVYCDMAGGGWTLVFKAVSGQAMTPYDAYKSDETYAESEMDALDVSNNYPNEYKNRIVLRWEEFSPSEARVVLYKRENAVIELKFDAQGSDKVNWFQKENLTEIPWDDVETENQNFFSIEETRHGRSFLINRGYGTCTADIGWMIITGNVCAWEKRFLSDLPNGHVVLYSTEAGYTNWNTYDTVGEADVLAVYVR